MRSRPERGRPLAHESRCVPDPAQRWLGRRAWGPASIAARRAPAIVPHADAHNTRRPAAAEIFPKACADGNAAALDKGLEALAAFSSVASEAAVARIARSSAANIAAKTFGARAGQRAPAVAMLPPQVHCDQGASAQRGVVGHLCERCDRVGQTMLAIRIWALTIQPAWSLPVRSHAKARPGGGACFDRGGAGGESDGAPAGRRAALAPASTPMRCIRAPPVLVQRRPCPMTMPRLPALQTEIISAYTHKVPKVVVGALEVTLAAVRCACMEAAPPQHSRNQSCAWVLVVACTCGLSMHKVSKAVVGALAVTLAAVRCARDVRRRCSGECGDVWCAVRSRCRWPAHRQRA